MASLMKRKRAGRLAWLGRWLYEPKVAGSSPVRPTNSKTIKNVLLCNLPDSFCQNPERNFPLFRKRLSTRFKSLACLHASVFSVVLNGNNLSGVEPSFCARLV